MKILAFFLIGAGMFCLGVKLPHYAFSLGILAIAVIMLDHARH